MKRPCKRFRLVVEAASKFEFNELNCVLSTRLVRFFYSYLDAVHCFRDNTENFGSSSRNE